MGNWSVVIVGTGCHHNTNRDEQWRDTHDGDTQFENFVSDLRQAGHTIHFASFVYGGGTRDDGVYLDSPKKPTKAELIHAIYSDPATIQELIDTHMMDAIAAKNDPEGVASLTSL